MRLLDLDPRWLIDPVDGRRIGFVFRSPTSDRWWQTCLFESGRRFFMCAACSERSVEYCEHSQAGLVAAAGIIAANEVAQLCNPKCSWTVVGDFDFTTLTITAIT